MDVSVVERAPSGRERCAYCRDGVTPADAVPCAACGTLLHRECWLDQPTCPSLGCAAARPLVARAGACLACGAPVAKGQVCGACRGRLAEHRARMRAALHDDSPAVYVIMLLALVFGLAVLMMIVFFLVGLFV